MGEDDSNTGPEKHVKPLSTGSKKPLSSTTKPLGGGRPLKALGGPKPPPRRALGPPKRPKKPQESGPGTKAAKAKPKLDGASAAAREEETKEEDEEQKTQQQQHFQSQAPLDGDSGPVEPVGDSGEGKREEAAVISAGVETSANGFDMSLVPGGMDDELEPGVVNDSLHPVEASDQANSMAPMASSTSSAAASSSSSLLVPVSASTHMLPPAIASAQLIPEAVGGDGSDLSKTSKRKRKSKMDVDVNIGQLQMKAFLKNRPNGKPAPSSLKRKEETRKKRAETMKLKKLGIDPVKHRKEQNEKMEKAEGTSKPSIFDQDVDDEEDGQAAMVPQVVFKDGKMVIDQSSLVYRHKAPKKIMDQPVQDEEVKRITASSFSKRRSTLRWTEGETRRFYDALRQWGQDFTMIAQLFPGRDRNQIARKYKKEEREKPHLIERALNELNRLPVDLEKIDPAFVEEVKEAEKRLAEMETVSKQAQAQTSTSQPLSAPPKPKRALGVPKKRVDQPGHVVATKATTKKKPVPSKKALLPTKKARTTTNKQPAPQETLNADSTTSKTSTTTETETQQQPAQASSSQPEHEGQREQQQAQQEQQHQRIEEGKDEATAPPKKPLLGGGGPQNKRKALPLSSTIRKKATTTALMGAPKPRKAPMKRPGKPKATGKNDDSSRTTNGLDLLVETATTKL